MRFDPPPELHEPHDLRIRQRRLLLPLRVDRHFLRPAGRQGVDGTLLGGDRLGDDLAVAHLEDVRVHQAGDQGLAEAEAGVHGGDLPVARDGVGREQDAGRIREDHLLHDHGHVDRTVVDAVALAVGHGPLGEQRRPAPADVLEDRRRPHDVQVRVLLAGEGGRRQVLCRRAGSDGVGGLLAEPGERAGDRRRQIVRDGDPFDGPADLRAERADRLPVVRVQARQLIEPIVDRRRFRHDPPEGVRRHAEAGRHADAFDPRQPAQVRALAADDRDLRLVNLLKIQHVLLDHCDTSEAAVLRRTAPADRITGAASSVEPLVGHVLISGCLPSDESRRAASPRHVARALATAPPVPPLVRRHRVPMRRQHTHVVPPFPQVVASADDSAPRPGSCRKPPSALYVKSGKERDLLAFAFCRPLGTDKLLAKRRRTAYDVMLSAYRLVALSCANAVRVLPRPVQHGWAGVGAVAVVGVAHRVRTEPDDRAQVSTSGSVSGRPRRDSITDVHVRDQGQQS